jgi:hypothetical protein
VQECGADGSPWITCMMHLPNGVRPHVFLEYGEEICAVMEQVIAAYLWPVGRGGDRVLRSAHRFCFSYRRTLCHGDVKSAGVLTIVDGIGRRTGFGLTWI